MRVLIQITHPAHVHFYRPYIEVAHEHGHEVHVIAIEKEMSLELLDAYGIDYEVVYEPVNRDLFHIRSQSKLTIGTYRAAKRFDPDVLTSIGGTSVSHVSKLVRGSSIVFYDTEHATLQNTITYPFADRICTPDCYQGYIGPKQVRYSGYQELAYLHPNRFTADPSVLDEAGLQEDERFVILRLVSWDAAHDVGDSGIDDVEDVVSKLEAAGTQVLITSEAHLPDSLEPYRVSIKPHRIHHLMYYADLYLGESATMATESAVLGTPAVFVSSSRRGYTDELEDKYGLVYNYSGGKRETKGLNRSISILESYDGDKWERKREELLADKIDTTTFIIDQLRSVTL